MNCLPLVNTFVILRCFGGSVLLFSFLFVVCFSSSCVLCAQCCQCHWIVHFWLPLQFSLTFIYWEFGKVASVTSLFVTLKNGDIMLISYFLQTSSNIIGLKSTRGNSVYSIQGVNKFYIEFTDPLYIVLGN